MYTSDSSMFLLVLFNNVVNRSCFLTTACEFIHVLAHCKSLNFSDIILLSFNGFKRILGFKINTARRYSKFRRF